MKLISWNVNGLRAALKKDFAASFDRMQPDVICLQETKAHPHQVDHLWPADMQVFWNPAQKPGYSGTLVATRLRVLSTRKGIGMEKHDQEGRVITVEHPDHFLVNVYTPNSQNELRRLDYRTREWDIDFLAYLKELEQDKPVIFCGDLNVAHREIDLANPSTNRKNAGFTDEERARFDEILAAGFLDTFRVLHPDTPRQYSWWSYRARARERNVGWRIDYICISSALREHLREAFILPDIHGSDHCPVGAVLETPAAVCGDR